ncbi:MAG: acylase [Acidobacteriota bacterium]
MKKILVRFSRWSLAFLVATTFLIIPSTSSVKLSLAEQVTIRRDTFGVPHILAETEEAASFGMGYAQAEDHAEEIARRFITARGEQARFFGAGEESDFRMKRYGNHEVAKNRFRELTPLFQRMLDAYAAGFNLYTEKNRADLPAWIPRFDGIDVLAHGRAEVMRFAFSEGAIRSVQMKYPDAAQPAGAQTDDESESQDTTDLGSNMWAIAGSRTTSGKPILLGNPHQPWAALYWEAHITVPGKINFYGSTFVGRPVLTTGFNEKLGWSHTVNYPDLADIFTLTIDPKNRDRYLFDGKTEPITKREIAVEIKQPDGTMKVEKRVYEYSHIGPIVHRSKDKAFALRSAILEEFRYYEQWYEMSKARNLEQFIAALKKNAIPMFNIAYADADGNIAYWWNSTVPRRTDDGTNYNEEVPATSKYVWTRLHRLEELPQLINPAGGYVQNCNDAPWWTSLRYSLDARKYPSYFEPNRQLGLRTQMSLEMMEGREKLSLEDVMRLKYQTRMLLADRIKPDLIRALRATANPSEDLKRGLAVIEAWDNRVARESRGAVLFKRFWDTYSRESKKAFAVDWDKQNPARTPAGLGDPPVAVRLFEEAVRWTRKTYGSESVSWGEVHRLKLAGLDLPVSGESGIYGVFRVVTFATAADGRMVVGEAEPGKPLQGGGDGWVFVVEFSSPLRAYSVLAYGETRNPRSRHSADQAALFADEKFKKVLFSEADIRASLERSYRPGR